MKLFAGSGFAKKELTSFNKVVLRLYCSTKLNSGQIVDFLSPFAWGCLEYAI